MKVFIKSRIFFLLTVLAYCTSGWSQETQGIVFFHGTLQQGLDEAAKRGVPVFIDAFTTWCGPCKMMSSTVFPDKEVGEYYNANFICMKIDMEKEEGPQIAAKYAVRSYPSFLFLKSNGDVVSRDVGARGAQEFITLGKAVVGKFDMTADYAKKYDAGDRSPELVLAYIKALNKSGKGSTKVFNEYCKAQKDMGSDGNIKIVYEGVVTADSKAFDYFAKYRSEIEKSVGKEAYLEKLNQVCTKTVTKAIEFNAPDLVAEAKNKYKSLNPSESNAFNALADMQFAYASSDAAGYVKAAQAYYNTKAKNDVMLIASMCKQVQDKFYEQKTVLNEAEKWAKKGVELEESPATLYNYAWFLNKNGEKKQARKNAEKALDIVSKANKPAGKIQKLLDDINEG